MSYNKYYFKIIAFVFFMVSLYIQGNEKYFLSYIAWFIFMMDLLICEIIENTKILSEIKDKLNRK